MRAIGLSAKWMRQPFRPCSPEFIASTCHAACCENHRSPIGFVVTIHPSEQAHIEARGGVMVNGLLQPPLDRKRKGKCPFKTPENLCGLHGTPDKPFGCIASPFTLNKAGKLVVRHRYINFKCFCAEGSMPVYRAQAGSFKAIFGESEAARLTAHFDAGGGDTTGEIEDHIFDKLNDNDKIKREGRKFYEGSRTSATSTTLRKTTRTDEQDACVEALFAHYRASGFPVYDLSLRERAERLAELMAFDHSTILKNGVIRQTMHGMSLCWHYHPHMWDIRCGGKKTPMEVFLNDRLFKQALAKRLEMGGYVTDGGVRKTLANYSGTHRVSTFRPTAAAAIYRQLLPAKGGVTWDFSGGFGGRLLGALACRRVKRYITTEPSTLTMEGLESMASELVSMSGRRLEVELHCVGSEDFVPDRNSLDLVFSSGPYFRNELYADEASQSYIKFPTRHEWLEGYMGGTLENCRRGLKWGGLLAVNIANVPSFPRLEADFLKLAMGEGWRLRTTLQIEMSRMLGTKGSSTGTGKQYKAERLFVFDKR